MEISKDDIMQSAKQLGIPPESVDALWSALQAQNRDKQTPAVPPSSMSTFSQIMYYFGALVVFGAMFWFFMLGLEMFGGIGIFLISCAYGIFFWLIGHSLWERPGLKVPAGLFYTLAVCMVPLAIYGLEVLTGLWEPQLHEVSKGLISEDSNMILMELGTIIAAAVALWFVPFPFLTAPLSIATWLFALSLMSVLQVDGILTFDQARWISLIVGAAMILIAYYYDCRTKEDYSFWGYLFGLAAFWLGLTWFAGESEAKWLIFFLINIGLGILSVFLQRRVFLIFGALGIFGYFFHLAFEIFEASIWFPFVLSFIGLGIIYLGVVLQRNEAVLYSKLVSLIPEKWRSALVPQERKR